MILQKTCGILPAAKGDQVLAHRPPDIAAGDEKRLATVDGAVVRSSRVRVNNIRAMAENPFREKGRYLAGSTTASSLRRPDSLISPKIRKRTVPARSEI